MKATTLEGTLTRREPQTLTKASPLKNPARAISRACQESCSSTQETLGLKRRESVGSHASRRGREAVSTPNLSLGVSPYPPTEERMPTLTDPINQPAAQRAHARLPFPSAVIWPFVAAEQDHVGL